jgi:hypothetical protein
MQLQEIKWRRRQNLLDQNIIGVDEQADFDGFLSDIGQQRPCLLGCHRPGAGRKEHNPDKIGAGANRCGQGFLCGQTTDFHLDSHAMVLAPETAGRIRFLGLA